jgi:chorismate mutase
MSADDQHSLAEVRARIDVLDDRIVAALSERFALALKAGVNKGADVQDEAREAEVLARTERLTAELGGDCAATRAIYLLILQLSRDSQRTGKTHGQITVDDS